MTVVGGGYERGITLTLVDGLAVDSATVDLHLRKCLFQLCHLTCLVLVNLVKTDEQTSAQCHFLVELVGKVEVVEIVLAK